MCVEKTTKNKAEKEKPKNQNTTFKCWCLNILIDENKKLIEKLIVFNKREINIPLLMLLSDFINYSIQ